MILQLVERKPDDKKLKLIIWTLGLDDITIHQEELHCIHIILLIPNFSVLGGFLGLLDAECWDIWSARQDHTPVL